MMSSRTIALCAAVGSLVALPFLYSCVASSAERSVPRQALLVLNKADDTLSLVDPSSNREIDTIHTGAAPHEIAVRGNLVFVSNYGEARPGNTISVIDLAKNKEVRRIDLGDLERPHGLFLRNGHLYFTAEGSQSVARLDAAAEKVDWRVKTAQRVTHMLVVTKDERKLYTSNIGSGSVSVVQIGQTAETSTVRQIEVGNGPEGIDISPDGKEVWVAHRDDGDLSIIDTATDQVIAMFDVGETPIRVKFTPAGDRVLISDYASSELIVVDAKTRTIEKRIPVSASPIGILVRPDGRIAWVSASRANKVLVIDLQTLEAAGEIEAGRTPDGLGWARLP